MRGLFPFRARGPSRIMVAGSFVTVSSSNPTVLRGLGFTVVRASQGVYTVTLQDAVNSVDSLVASAHPKTEGTELFVSGDIDALTTSVFKLHVTDDGGTAQDDAGTLVSFQAVCRIGNYDA